MSKITYGSRLGPAYGGRMASVVGEIDKAPAGNVILRVGRENEPGGSWHQTEHVALKPAEAVELGCEIVGAAVGPMPVTDTDADGIEVRLPEYSRAAIANLTDVDLQSLLRTVAIETRVRAGEDRPAPEAGEMSSSDGLGRDPVLTPDEANRLETVATEPSGREIVSVGWDGVSKPMYRYRDELHLPEHSRSMISAADRAALEERKAEERREGPPAGYPGDRCSRCGEELEGLEHDCPESGLRHPVKADTAI